MSKVFISTLGATKYEECVYRFGEDGLSHKTFFIQDASISYFCNDWDATKGDRIKILCTDTAFQRNWQDDGHKDRVTREVVKRAGLGNNLKKIFQEDLSNTKLNAETIPVMIPEGKNSDEIWQIFETLYQQVENNDEVWFDITHAFRSIPMLVLVCIIYARVLKNITVKSITYGAYDARENNIAPVFDLTRFITLMDWTNAAKDFSEYGQTTQLKKLLTADVDPLLKESKGKHMEAKLSKAIGKGIGDFTDAISRNMLAQVISFSDLKKHLADYRSAAPTEMKAFIPIVERIEHKIKPFEKGSLENVFSVSRWCFDHGMYQNAYSMLLEGCISIILDMVGEEYIGQTGIVEQKRKIPIFVASCRRELKKQTCTKTKDELIAEFKLKEKQEHWREEFTAIINKVWLVFTDEVEVVFEDLNTYRNAFMHCGTGTNPIPSDLITKLNTYNSTLENWYGLQTSK